MNPDKVCTWCGKEFRDWGRSLKCPECKLQPRSRAPHRTRNDLASVKMKERWERWTEGIGGKWWPDPEATYAGPGIAGWLLNIGLEKPVTIGFFRRKRGCMVIVTLVDNELVFTPRCYGWKFKKENVAYIQGWMKATEECQCSACLAALHLTEVYKRSIL